MDKNKKTLIGLVAFLGFPFVLKFFSIDMVLHEGAFWLLFLLIIAWIYLVEKRSLDSIGWKKLTVKTTGTGLGLGLLLFIVFGMINVAIQAVGIELNRETAELMASQSLPMLLLIALRAGVVEEVLYRGYAFERIYEITKSKWLAALVPVVIFMLAHLSWGVGHLLFIFFAGGLFMLVYILKKNLGLLIVAHFTTDVFALLVLPMMLEAK